MSPRLCLLVLTVLCAACASDSAETSETSPASTPTTEVVVESTETVADDVETDGSPDTGDAAISSSSTSEVVAAEEPDDEGPTTFAPLTVDCATIARVPVGLQTGTITSGGVQYRYQWTVPSSYDGTAIPVVLDFHAIGSNGAQQAVFGGWAALAEAEGFLAVQPTGIAIPPDDRASWELPQFDTDQRDDVTMVRDLLEHVAANVCIDPTRVYATGMSNGALFTSVIVCELGDFVAAAVSVAGVTHDDSCAPSRPVPYLAFHGTDDTTIPYRGGGETTLEGADGGAFFEQVMPDEFAEFAADFDCAESVDTAIGETVTLTSYTGCANDAELGFYTIDGGGHTWPGSQISAALPSLGVTTMEVDATAIAWDFFQRHAL